MRNRFIKYHVLILAIVVLIGFILRFYQIDKNPPGLYIDEVSIGTNAFKILTTGKDEYGVPYPLSFKSFGDYKMPLYIYFTAGAMYFIGNNEFAIRFTSALAGSLTVLLFYFFTKELVSMDKKVFSTNLTNYFPIISTLLLAVSPWHIQFSRAGFEATVGLLFFLSALLLAAKFYNTQRSLLFFLSIFSFAATIYTYNTYRVLTPVVVLFIIAYFFKVIPEVRKTLFASFLGFFIFIFPMVMFSLTLQGSERFKATSSFVEYSAPLIQDKVVMYPMIYLKNYISFFSIDFLFNFGDGIGRHQIPGFGNLPRWELPFLLIGIYFLLSTRKSKTKGVIFVLFFLSPIAASLVRPSPHTLRDLQFVIPVIMTIAFGIIYAMSFIRKRWVRSALVIFCIISLFEFIMYFHFYHAHYPQINVIDWGGGYKDVVLKTKELKHRYKYIFIDNNLGFATSAYFKYYDESVRPVFVDSTWKKSDNWNFSVLYICPYFGINNSDKIISNIFLPNRNHDIFAQFWEL